MDLIDLGGAWNFRQVTKDEWMPANVPGGVHTDLLALGQIPDPFVGDNEKAVAWVAKEDWVYSKQFDLTQSMLDRKNIWLVCDGLDTLAAVSVNGQQLGNTDNMFRQYRWDIKKHLKSSGNELVITFRSPVNVATDMQSIRPMAGVPQAIAGGPHIRKAPCQFGWDWGPQLPPIGIWKGIRLELFDVARIEDVHLRQRHSENAAMVSANITIDGKPDGLTWFVWVTSPTGVVSHATGSTSSTLSVEIKKPDLWWPNGYGEQPLYHVRISLVDGNATIDEKEYSLGLRTVELRQQPDQWGRSFTFVVNGVPIFAKGSNWIPADSFPTRITRDSLEALIKSAVAVNQNMLRIWGGGFYEEDIFYDLCDKYGILLWQDFIFSCSIYPLDERTFVENVHIEVEENIKRLRHHASLALWCGNNEMEQGWVEWGWNKDDLQPLKGAYDTFFHHTLKDWCKELDPDHSYWPSSPSSDTPFEVPNGQIQGDAHYWDVWHGRKPFTAYRDQYPRFMSEFGFQALPPIETIATFAEPKDWNMTSYIMERHQKNASGNSLMVSQMLETFQLPKDFGSLVYLSLVLQAEGIRYGVEHWRRYPERVAGTIYWQLNDCWPVASWSSLDYFGRWKALHYAAKRFYAPVLLSIEDAPPSQGISVTNDTTADFFGKIEWNLLTLDGELLRSGEEYAKVGALTHCRIADFNFSEIVSDLNAREVVFCATLLQGKETIAIQTAYFVPTKHLNLSEPGITVAINLKDGKLQIDLSTERLARLVECKLDGVDVVFSDNYFDIVPGQPRSISAPIPSGWSIKQARSAFRIRSVFDSYTN